MRRGVSTSPAPIGAFPLLADITEGERAKEQLLETTETLTAMLQASPSAVVLLDVYGKVKMWNRAAQAIFGWQEEEVLDQPYPIVPQDRLPEFRANHEAVLRGGTFDRVEVQRQRRDGSLIDVCFSAAPLRDPSNNVRGAVVLLWDITPRKRTEQALLESEARYREVASSIPGIVYQFRLAKDGTFSFPFVSEGASVVCGITPEEIRADASAIFSRVVEDDLHLIDQAIAESAQSMKTASAEYRIRHMDGQVKWVRSVSTPSALGDGGILWNCVALDITDRKQAEEALRASEEAIQRQLERMTALRAIDEAITASLDLRVTFSVLLDQVTSQLRADAASVLLLDPGTQTLEYAAGRGFRTDAITQSSVRLGEGYAGRAVMERLPVYVPNLKEDADYSMRARPMPEEEFLSYYAAPLIGKGLVKGVLEIFHRTLAEPDPEWLDFVEALARQAATAIDSATLFADLQRSTAELQFGSEAALEAWVAALDLRCRETEGHTQRVMDMTVRLATEFGFVSAQLGHVRRGALLHDIGRMGIPDTILLKPGPLTDDEWDVMRRHPIFAHDILSRIPFLREALDVPYCHHERWDGSGYPRGLRAEDIPLTARIFAVADVWDALRSDRMYRPAWPDDKALDHIESLAGCQFDPRVVEVFLKMAH